MPVVKSSSRFVIMNGARLEMERRLMSVLIYIAVNLRELIESKRFLRCCFVRAYHRVTAIAKFSRCSKNFRSLFRGGWKIISFSRCWRRWMVWLGASDRVLSGIVRLIERWVHQVAPEKWPGLDAQRSTTANFGWSNKTWPDRTIDKRKWEWD